MEMIVGKEYIVDAVLKDSEVTEYIFRAQGIYQGIIDGFHHFFHVSIPSDVTNITPVKFDEDVTGYTMEYGPIEYIVVKMRK